MATLKIHGCRGSTAYHSPATEGFGGNSSCYSLNTGNDIIILDAGTGLLTAENEVFASQPENVYVVLSHEHLDHIEGLGTSALSYIPGRDVKIFGRKGVRKGLENLFPSENFPTDINRDMLGISEINEVEGQFELGDVVVEAMEGNHQEQGASAYRLNLDDKVLVYATDQEFSFDHEKNPLDNSFKERYTEFIRDADILIADAHFTKEEYVDQVPLDIRGWGHSYAEEVLDMAAEAGVRKVILTHHKPKRSDDALTDMEQHAKQYCLDKGYALEVEYARQGAHMEVE